MADIIVTIETEDKRWSQSLPKIEALVEEVKNAAFAYLQKWESLDFMQSAKPLKINLCLSDDEHVHQLNRDFRHIDKATNVLSFANLDFADFTVENALFSEIELGDIIFSFDTLQREAESENITLKAHFCHLLVHGFLHLCGYDHIADDEAEYMENLEKNILQILQIANPYEEKLSDGQC